MIHVSISDNQTCADNQQGRSVTNKQKPSETTRQSPEELRAYLLGALHDGTFNSFRKTHRFSQSSIEWLLLLQSQLASLGYKSWIYKEGKNRNVYVLETKASFLQINFNPNLLTTKASKIAYIRGFFDAEGGLPKDINARFYIQLVQKNYLKLQWIRKELIDIDIICGCIHNPSARVDPEYFRFFISAKSYLDFAVIVGSWHPRKKLIFEDRVKI